MGMMWITKLPKIGLGTFEKSSKEGHFHPGAGLGRFEVIKARKLAPRLGKCMFLTKHFEYKA